MRSHREVTLIWITVVGLQTRGPIVRQTGQWVEETFTVRRSKTTIFNSALQKVFSNKTHWVQSPLGRQGLKKKDYLHIIHQVCQWIESGTFRNVFAMFFRVCQRFCLETVKVFPFLNCSRSRKNPEKKHQEHPVVVPVPNPSQAPLDPHSGQDFGMILASQHTLHGSAWVLFVFPVMYALSRIESPSRDIAHSFRRASLGRSTALLTQKELDS